MPNETITGKRSSFQTLRILFICGYLMSIGLTFVPSLEISKHEGMFGMGEVVKHTYSLYEIIRLLYESGEYDWQLFYVTVFAVEIAFVILAIRYPKRWVFISGASFTAFFLLWSFFTPSREGIKYILIPRVLGYVADAFVLLGFFARPTDTTLPKT